VAQYSAHGDDLTFVVECVCEDVMENECRCSDGGISIGEMQFRAGVELFLGETRQVGDCLPHYLVLQFSGVGNGRTAGGVPAPEGSRPERMNPERLAVENMNYLGTEVREAEAR
jgi:hypothetical protein